ncbi:MAG: DHHA1 domain-containing protein, partial [Candidatus Limnocylindria bacterium]
SPGLVGLVAGRLADALTRPVAAATLVGDEVRGSVRAPVDFHVAAALEACSTLLTKRGGHAAAGGFSLLPANWLAFGVAFAALPRPFPISFLGERQRPGRLVVDLVLTARRVDWTLAAELDRLAPYGPGHTEPMLAVTGMVVAEARRVGPAEAHIVFRLRRGLEAFDAIAFGMGADRPLPAAGVALDLAGTLERDTFGGEPRLRLRVADFADTSASPLLARRVAPRQLARAG